MSSPQWSPNDVHIARRPSWLEEATTGCFDASTPITAGPHLHRVVEARCAAGTEIRRRWIGGAACRQVATSATIRSITICVCRTSAAKCAWLVGGTSCPSVMCARGHVTETRRPPRVTEPFSVPWRTATPRYVALRLAHFGDLGLKTSRPSPPSRRPRSAPTASRAAPAMPVIAGRNSSGRSGRHGIVAVGNANRKYGFIAVPPSVFLVVHPNT
jgi:hypothetical protein